MSRRATNRFGPRGVAAVSPIAPVSLITLSALIALGSACTEPSTPAPDAPRFDATERIVTRLPRVTLTGTAEYGAKLELTRKPAFAAGETPREHTAHPYTAEFRIEDVPLREGVNLFSLVAIDWEGRRSEPAELVVEYEPRAGGLVVTLASSTVVAGPGAGRGQLRATAAFAVKPEEASAFADREVRFRLSGVSTQIRTAVTDDRGIAEADFTALDVAGPGTVEATSDDLTGSAAFVVEPGPAATLSLSLVAEGHDGSGSDDLAIPAGILVDVVAAVEDASGNDVTAPVVLHTDAVGAFVEGSRLGNLHVPGVYRVVAAVNGALTEGNTGVSAEARLEVLPGEPAAIVLSAPADAVAGVPFTLTAGVVDAFDNPLPEQTDALVLASDDPQFTLSAPQRRATLRTAGTRTITATLPGSDLEEEIAVDVRPGPAASLSLSLTSPTQLTGVSPFTVPASETARIEVTTSVTDAFGNAVDAPVHLTTTYDAGFLDSTLPALVFAGAYEIGAWVAGSAVTATAPFVVAPAAPDVVDLVLASSTAAAGEVVPYSAAVRDRFGNDTGHAVTVTVDGADDAATVLADSVTLRAASDTAWTVRATAEAGVDDATASLLVNPAAPAAVSLSLSLSPGDGLTVTAGEEPAIAATVVDAFGNVVDDPPLEFLVVPLAGTQAAPPGPFVADGRVQNLVRPGQYRCVVRVLGTNVTSDASPEHVLTVVPGDPASLTVQASDTSTFVGWPIALTTVLRDAFGNVVSDAPSASFTLERDGTDAGAITSPWVPDEAGDYTIHAEVTVDGVVFDDRVDVSVAALPDHEAPVITFSSEDRTVSAWPPEGDEVPAGECDGARLTVSIEDASNLETVWFAAGGLWELPPESWDVDPGTSSVHIDVAVCTEDLLPSARGEVLLDVSTVDVHGNFSRASSGWCIDPDAESYEPAPADVARCAIERAHASLADVRAIAANKSGQWVLAAVDGGDAGLRLVPRFPYEGPGTLHVLDGHGSPGGVAFLGTAAFTSTLTTTGSAVARTVGLTHAGEGTTDVFVSATSTTHRFHGVLVGGDGALYTTWGERTGVDGGSRIDRFPQPVTGAAVEFDPADPPFAESPELVLTHLCQGATGSAILAAGRNDVGRPVLARVTPGNVETLWTASSGAFVRGCAADGSGVVLSLEVSGTTTTARSVWIDLDAGATAQDVFTGFAEGESPEWIVGPAVHDGRFVVVAKDGVGTGALLRMVLGPR